MTPSARGTTSNFQRAVSEAFLRIMRTHRPDLIWSVREAGKVREIIAEPDDPNTLPDGPSRAAT